MDNKLYEILIIYGNKMTKEPEKFMKNYASEKQSNNPYANIEYNPTIKKIVDIIKKELKENLPNIKESDLEENGKIYYMNGKNGTIFDWTMNEKIADFMCFYKDGSSNIYLYNYGEGQPYKNKELPRTFDKNEAYELAIRLNSVIDRNGVFDKAITDYNSDIVITDKEKLEFEDNCNIVKGESKI